MVSPTRAIAIEVGDSQIRGGLITKNRDGIQFAARSDESLGDNPDVQHTLDRIRTVAESVIMLAKADPDSAGLKDWKDLAGIGVAVPDAVDKSGNLGQCTTLINWDGEPIRQHLQDTFSELDSSHVVVLNDANAAALGEAKYGRGKDVSSIDLVYFIITAGIGAGIVLDGRLRIGASGYAGEWGHVVVDPNGPECTGCRVQHGCLEMVASGTAMAREAAELIESGGGDAMFEAVARRVEAEKRGVRALYNGGGSAQFYTELIDGGTNCTIWASEVITAAQAGDAAARKIVERAGQGLGKALVQALHILNPDMIVVGGITSRSTRTYFKEAETWAIDHALSSARQIAKILPSSLQDFGSLYGAAAEVFNSYPEIKEE